MTLFYCESCSRKHQLPQTPALNLESCEMCGHERLCYNNPNQVGPELKLKLPDDRPVLVRCRNFANELLGFGWGEEDRKDLAYAVEELVLSMLAGERLVCATIAEQVGEQRSPRVAANIIRGRSKE